jgi:hypothetical protein
MEKSGTTQEQGCALFIFENGIEQRDLPLEKRGFKAEITCYFFSPQIVKTTA